MTNAKNDTNFLRVIGFIAVCLMPVAIGRELGLLGSVSGFVVSFVAIFAFAWWWPANASQDLGVIISMSMIAVGFSEDIPLGPDKSWIIWFARWGIAILVMWIGTATAAKILRPKRPDTQSAEASNS